MSELAWDGPLCFYFGALGGNLAGSVIPHSAPIRQDAHSARTAGWIGWAGWQAGPLKALPRNVLYIPLHQARHRREGGAVSGGQRLEDHVSNVAMYLNEVAVFPLSAIPRA